VVPEVQNQPPIKLVEPETFMNFELCLATDGGHAIMTNHADVTHSSAIQHQRAMQAFADEHKVTRFLIDTRGKRFVGGPVELYTFVRNTLPAEGYDRHWHVALVTSPDDNSHDFLETVCHNVGYHVMVFKNFTSAQDWLRRT
jgi:hypothetical protein